MKTSRNVPTQSELPFSEPIDFSLMGEVTAYQLAIRASQNSFVRSTIQDEGLKKLGYGLLFLFNQIQDLSKEEALALLSKEFGLEE